MIKSLLIRQPSEDFGTFGHLSVYREEKGLLCLDALELPWRDNARCISCIPEGEYRAEFMQTGKGKLYQLFNVPGRDGILIHRGNWAGRKDLHLRCDSEGCILLGEGRADVIDQPGILKTKQALERFHAFTEGLPMLLEIQWRKTS